MFYGVVVQTVHIIYVFLCVHPSIRPFRFNLFLYISAEEAIVSPLWPTVWLANGCLLLVNAFVNQLFWLQAETCHSNLTCMSPGFLASSSFNLALPWAFIHLFALAKKIIHLNTAPLWCQWKSEQPTAENVQSLYCYKTMLSLVHFIFLDILFCKKNNPVTKTDLWFFTV